MEKCPDKLWYQNTIATYIGNCLQKKFTNFKYIFVNIYLHYFLDFDNERAVVIFI